MSGEAMSEWFLWDARIERAEHTQTCTCTDTTARVHMELRPRGQSVSLKRFYVHFHTDTPERFPSASVLKADQWPTRLLCLSCTTSSTLAIFWLDFGMAL